jgi:hypothetical protein
VPDVISVEVNLIIPLEPVKPVPIAINKGLAATIPPATVESVEIPWGLEIPPAVLANPAVVIDVTPSPNAPVAVVDV